MKNRIFWAIGDIDPELVAEADTKKKKTLNIRVISAIAACAAIVVVGSAAYIALPRANDAGTGEDAVAKGNADGVWSGDVQNDETYGDEQTVQATLYYDTAETTRIYETVAGNAEGTSMPDFYNEVDSTESAEDGTLATAIATTRYYPVGDNWIDVHLYFDKVIIGDTTLDSYDADLCFKAMMDTGSDYFHLYVYDGSNAMHSKLAMLLWREYSAGHEIFYTEEYCWGQNYTEGDTPVSTTSGPSGTVVTTTYQTPVATTSGPSGTVVMTTYTTPVSTTGAPEETVVMTTYTIPAATTE